MLDNSVICLVVVSYLLFCAATSGPWPSPELGKINETDSGVFNGTLTVSESSWIGSLSTLGCMIGTIVAGFLVENIGRKKTILIIPIPLIISYFMLAFSKKMYLFYIARFLAGFPMGCIFVTLPMYTGEVAKNHHRGLISGMFGFFVHLSHILTYAAGPYMGVTPFNVMLGILPCLFTPLYFYFGVESPHYYIKHGKFEEAKNVLKKIRNNDSVNDQEIEFKYLKVLLENEEHGNLSDLFKHKGTRKALLMVLMLFTFSIFSGISAVLTYTQQIFEFSGTSIPAEQCSIILGVVQLIAGGVTPFLIANLGRKTLILGSNFFTAISFAALGVYFYLDYLNLNLDMVKFVPIAALISAVVACSVGMSSIPMVFLSEVFPNAVKGSAAAICTFYYWSMSFGINKFFPILINDLGTWPVFLGFSGVCFLAIPFTMFFVLETKDKSLKDILDTFNE